MLKNWQGSTMHRGKGAAAIPFDFDLGNNRDDAAWELFGFRRGNNKSFGSFRKPTAGRFLRGRNF